MSSEPWRRVSGLLRRLYRDQENGMLLGVCAGLADYFDWPVIAVRAAAAASLLFWTIPTAVVYVMAGLMLKDRPLRYRGRNGEPDFWKRESRHPRGGERA